MNGEAFFDSNILLYLISTDLAKADRAEELIGGGGVISVQVLNEFAAVASRKYRISWGDIRQVLSTIRSVCTLKPITIRTHEDGLSIAERYRLRFYDSLIVAAALDAGCSILFSEDMQHGQRIGGLTIRNPFMPAAGQG